jgi:hypothetical protein
MADASLPRLAYAFYNQKLVEVKKQLEDDLLTCGSVSVTLVPVSVFSIAFLYNYTFLLSLESITCIPTCRDAPYNKTKRRYFEFKRL